MKKILVIFLSLTMILGGFMSNISQVHAELDKDLELTIIKVKKLFNISNEYDNFTQQLDSNNEKNNFYLNWSDSKNKLPNISVNVDSDGFIKSFNKYYPETEMLDNDEAITKLEAQKLASDFIKKVAPEIAENIKLKINNLPLNLNDDSYNFEFYRLENNIPFYYNNISVTINKYTKEANNYNANWDKEALFPDPKDAIKLETAKLAFEKDIGLHLIYKTSSRMYIMPGPNEMNRFLAYGLLGGNKAIDAFTGKPIDVSYFRAYANDKLEFTVAGDSGLTPYEQEEIDKLKGIKDIVEIEKLSRDILKLDESYKLTNNNLFSSWNNKDEFQWMLQFKKPIDENNNVDASISLNAKTGELISFNIYENQDPMAKPKINKEQALELAKDYLKKNIGDKYSQLEYVVDGTKDGELNYSFNFIRKTDGIYIEGDGAYIGIDSLNKKVVSYSLTWYKDKMPSKENIISLDKAYEILFNSVDYELRYVKVNDWNNIDENKEEIKLVYDFKTDNPIIIDPITGKFLDYNGKELTEYKIIEYTDIDQSYAKDKIKALSEYGISFDDNKFRPKDEMKQSEFLFLIWKSLNNSVEYKQSEEEIYKQLKDRDIVRSGDSEKNSLITKEDAVKYIIRAMDYDKLADESEIFKDIWADSSEITKGLKGYMNIAYGFKIIVGDGKANRINPKYVLHREDGASIIYNYIFMK